LTQRTRVGKKFASNLKAACCVDTYLTLKNGSYKNKFVVVQNQTDLNPSRNTTQKIHFKSQPKSRLEQTARGDSRENIPFSKKKQFFYVNVSENIKNEKYKNQKHTTNHRT